MADRINSKHVRKLSFEDKARILAWREDGVSAAVIPDLLGRHRTSILRLLTKVKSPPLYPCQKEGLRASCHHKQACPEVHGEFMRKFPGQLLAT
jgi:hypothetical protein